ncbi:hypothetical protein USDA257_c24070 [Sinorhizobium fredii USDA 257]|uniref:Uncharacterized protein n=1 Tax=Sinorhizobium fredii (strain USDA 257) TaxID=1185652 RepID=I3X527_SINF2|nr:hypothetical protein USDA257_c24070 [Sinorhizobium fredii USDA 257]
MLRAKRHRTAITDSHCAKPAPFGTSTSCLIVRGAPLASGPAMRCHPPGTSPVEELHHSGMIRFAGADEALQHFDATKGVDSSCKEQERRAERADAAKR